MFELQITEPVPQEPITWNYEELKTELSTSLAEYDAKVYTEDTITLAKADVANLRKLKKALNDERLRREKAYMQPFNEFKAQVKEICTMIDSTTEKIDSQLSEFEKARIDKKQAEIAEKFAGMDFPDWVSLEQVQRPEWLNKSVSMKKISAELDEILLCIQRDITTLESLADFHAIEYYQRTLNLQDAIAEGQRLEKLRAEKEAFEKSREIYTSAKGEDPTPAAQSDQPIEIVDEDPTPEPTYKFKFEVEVTKRQAWALHDFCKAQGIKLTQIKE